MGRVKKGDELIPYFSLAVKKSLVQNGIDYLHITNGWSEASGTPFFYIKNRCMRVD